ncbi:MAG: glutamate synthase subunit beta [Bacteroidetes bacterium]|nr:MAG: glutamate synthase subunit beta [Bacteroidota bacterium]
MGDPRGFINIPRKESGNRPVQERIHDYGEVEQTLNDQDRKDQAARCMDCGIPFCQWACPVMNNMPEWQDAIYKDDWKLAIDLLHVTNNFPEFTGRICPAPCETGCVLALHEEPVTIRENEAAVTEKAFERGYIVPSPPAFRTGKSVAVIGSGPAGMACADLLNKAGHSVTLFEKDDAPGGLLRYGIPDFKLAKHVIDRRLDVLKQEGLIIRTGVDVGTDITAKRLTDEFDAVCIAVGAMHPRDLPVEGRELEGVHFAMDFLKQQNKVVRGDHFPESDRISAKGKHVLVIGGGDTGSDCVGTSNRQKAASITQIEILPEPPLKRDINNPWPYWAKVQKTSSSHEEGCQRMWNVLTQKFSGENGKVKAAEIAEVEWTPGSNGNMEMRVVPGSERTIPVDLVLLSMGFVHPVQEGLLNDLDLKYTHRGNVMVKPNNQTHFEKIFATGDSILGASLVVNAIASGRKTARAILEFLKATEERSCL